MRANVTQHLFRIDHRHAVRSTVRHINARLIRTDRYSKRQRIIPVQLIQRNLNRLIPHIRAKNRQRVHERPSVLHVRQRHKVLRMQFRRHTQPPIPRNRHMKHPGNIGQSQPIHHTRLRWINHCNLRLRRRPVPRRIWIHMRRIQPAAIPSHRQITRPAPGLQSQLFFARSSIQNRNVIPDAIRDVQRLPRAILHHARRLEPRPPRRLHASGLWINDGDSIVPGIRHKQPLAIGRKRKSPWQVPHRNRPQHRARRRIQHPHLIRTLAQHIQPRPVRRHQQFQR